jgi:hypothetical protein
MGRAGSSEGGYATAMKMVADLTFNLPLIDTMPAQCHFQIEEPGTILNRNRNINHINRSTVQPFGQLFPLAWVIPA